MPASVIEVQQLGLQLEQQLILQHLQFSVQRGDFIGIIGPNGAGKSSLLKLISGQLPLQQGQIQLDGKPLAQYSARARAQKLAVVSQHDISGFELTVYQLAAMGLLPHKSWFEANHSVDEHQIALALEKVGLTDKSQQLLSRLSGGELQRALIAKALVQQPQILLLDEPTNHLDVLYQHQILQLTARLGITVLACLHDLNLAAIYCNKLLLLQQGQQRAFGTVQQVLTPSLLQQVFGLPCTVQTQGQHAHLQVSFLPEGL